MHSKNYKKEWFKLSLIEQMGNIGSEVGRALIAKKNNSKRLNSILERMLDLFDMTKEDPSHSRSKRKEIFRAREVVCDYFYGDNEYNSSYEFLDKYFLYFGIAANRMKKNNN